MAKVLVDYAEEHEELELRAGLVEGRLVSTTDIATLATLPSLDELRAKLVGLLQGPARKLATLMQAPAGQLGRLVGAREAQLGQGADD